MDLTFSDFFFFFFGTPSKVIALVAAVGASEECGQNLKEIELERKEGLI